jgi:hypothetical protein
MKSNEEKPSTYNVQSYATKRAHNKAIRMTKIKIVNVVATVALNQRIDLFKHRQFKEILCSLDFYGGRVAYVKTKTMQDKVSIFASGISYFVDYFYFVFVEP